MQAIKVTSFQKVFSVLQSAAGQLKTQNREEAKSTIAAIASDVDYLDEKSTQAEADCKVEQQKITEQLANIIKQEATVRMSYLDTERAIRDMNVEIQKKVANRDELQRNINELTRQLQQDQRELAEHQARWNELNDDSVGSIFRSIACLGLDRAVMGITSLINQDKASIRRLNEQLDTFRKALAADSVSISQTTGLLVALNARKASHQATRDRLHAREVALQHEEKAVRKRLTFFTNASLFYGKLAIIVRGIDQRLDDVLDIVNELNDTTPTIIDFDPSGDDLLSLSQALMKFDNFLSSQTA